MKKRKKVVAVFVLVLFIHLLRVSVLPVNAEAVGKDKGTRVIEKETVYMAVHDNKLYVCNSAVDRIVIFSLKNKVYITDFELHKVFVIEPD
jgi:hypothetical protein